MINVAGLNKIYSNSDGEVQALSDISFAVEKGEFVSVIGPSGCGKTTLIKIIGNLISHDSGHILIDGFSPEQARLKGMFSFVFQNPVLLPWRNVIDNVRLPLEIIHHETRNPKQLLSVVGLEGFESRYPKELSGGMQQRVALARALTFDPKILIMDEPFGALDEFTRNELNLQLLKIWYEIKVTIIFVTHSISEAVFLSDKVVVLSERPGSVIKIKTISFKRPRNLHLKEQPEFHEITKCLRKKLE